MTGIFEHGKAENNKLILKALIYGPKTTTQIAEYIYFNRKQKPKIRLDQKRAREPNKNEVNHIESQISRKGPKGRHLQELEIKKYIFQEDSLRKLTMKGKAVALTLVDSVYDVMPYIIEEHENNISEALQLVKANPFLKKLLNQEVLREILKIASTPELYQRVKDITNRLMTQGVDIDSMSDLEFQNIVGSELFSSLIRRRSLEGTRFNKLKNVLLDDLKHYEKGLKG